MKSSIQQEAEFRSKLPRSGRKQTRKTWLGNAMSNKPRKPYVVWVCASYIEENFAERYRVNDYLPVA